MWEKGVEPACPPEEEFNPCTQEAIVWLGYMLARAVDWDDDRRKVAELCGASNREIKNLKIDD